MKRKRWILAILAVLVLASYNCARAQQNPGKFELSFTTGGLLENDVLDARPYSRAFLTGLGLGSGLPSTNPVDATADFDMDTGYLYLFSVTYNYSKYFGGEFTVGGSTSDFGGDVTGVVIVEPTIGATVPLHASYSFDNNQLLVNADFVARYPWGNFAPFFTIGAGFVYFGGELKGALIEVAGEEPELLDKNGFASIGVDRGLLEFNETSFQWSIGTGLKYYIKGGFLLQFEIKDHIVVNPANEFFRGFEDTDTLHLIEISGGIGVTF